MAYITQVKDSTGKIYNIRASGIDAIKDWAENDPNSPYYIRNRTHYENNGEVKQLDNKYIKDVWDEIHNLSDNFENYVTLSNPETIDGDLKVDGKGLFFENIYIGAEIPNNKVVTQEELSEQLENKVDSDKFALGTEIGAIANTFRGDIYLEKVNSEGTYVETISIKDALQATGDLSQYRLKTDLNFYSTDGIIRPAYFDKIYKGNSETVDENNRYIILEELLEQLQDYRTKDDLQYNDTSIALLTDIPEYPDMDNYLQKTNPVAEGSFKLESGYLSINNYIVWSSDNQLSFIVDGDTYNVKDYIDERVTWEKGEGEDSVQQVNTGAKANGIYSVAEGELTEVIVVDDATDRYNDGRGAHAEGGGTTAGGSYSHAEGNNTITNNAYEHAEGIFNVSHYNQPIYPSADNTIHSIGIGSNMQNRKNAVEVMQNGDVYIFGIGGYDGTNIEEAMTVQEVIAELTEVIMAEGKSFGGVNNESQNSN